ncbi:hypothetical protein NLJ89_g9010 [Agrocybe chaxingu]|uniref:Reverse transcriptase domain-containing protein n=1 Tax=Agrocybe chaxingu TaxID=84603 RepID=A0A9W8MRM5_9AGAR|nr:hypothetical protein NLJ89_g9010 [Agrocybe chaxingu]
MNPPEPDLAGFDRDHLAHVEELASEIPPITLPSSDFPELQEDITLSDIHSLKTHLSSHHPNSALGLDRISKTKILSVDDELLCDFFNECVHHRGSPRYWLLTHIIGAPKRGKSAEDVRNYRAIALESCLLKALTFIIHTKFSKALDRAGIIPPTQNGFRKDCRTNNNSFILRSIIDKVTAEGDSLYVAFVDISNAFPSTNHSSLWVKLDSYGLTGQYFDWIRMLYSQMTYVISHNGQFSDEFKSLAGVLIGDPLSPTLWNIFLSTFSLDLDQADATLTGYVVSHLEHADDIVLLSRSSVGLQRHLDRLHQWCSRNFLILNPAKTWLMIFGPLPNPLPLLFINGILLRFTDSFKYIGVTFSSTSRDYFASHYRLKAAAAYKSARAIVNTELYIGRNRLPPRIARTLYFSLIDCHLIHASDIAPDVSQYSLHLLQNIQDHFLRRLLLVSNHCPRPLLYTETNIMPIQARRALLACDYLISIINHPTSSLLFRSLRESEALRISGHPSWMGDLDHALRAASENSIPLPPLCQLSSQVIRNLKPSLIDHTWNSLQSAILRNRRLILLHGRKEPLRNGAFREFRFELLSSSPPQPLPQLRTSSNPPSVFIFNVGRSSPRQLNDGPVGDTSLFQSFINALQSIKAKGYVVQGAMYGPEGANIFIDTDDEEWDAQISIH